MGPRKEAGPQPAPQCPTQKARAPGQEVAAGCSGRPCCGDFTSAPTPHGPFNHTPGLTCEYTHGSQRSNKGQTSTKTTPVSSASELGTDLCHSPPYGMGQEGSRGSRKREGALNEQDIGCGTEALDQPGHFAAAGVCLKNGKIFQRTRFRNKESAISSVGSTESCPPGDPLSPLWVAEDYLSLAKPLRACLAPGGLSQCS